MLRHRLACCGDGLVGVGIMKSLTERGVRQRDI